MIYFGLIFLVFQTILAFIRPRLFVIFYLIFTTSFLGFLPKLILIYGNEIGLYYQSLLMLANYIVYYKRSNLFPRYLVKILNTLIIFYLFGIFYPLINGSSTLLQSIIASKEFSTIFFVHYLLIRKKDITTKQIYSVISFLGYYFLFILLLFVLFKIVPPEYVKEGGRIQFYFPTILSLFLYIKAGFATTLIKKIYVIFLLLIWTIGMYIEGHAAILLTTLFGTLILIFRLPILKLAENYNRLLLAIVSFALILFFSPLKQYITEITTRPEFLSRLQHNSTRLDLIFQKPLFGYGFLHKSVTNFKNSNVYTESLSSIDSGYIDLLAKFGIIGLSIYLVIISILFFHKKKVNVNMMSLRIFFLQYFVVNITWSVFTFEMGIITLSISIYLHFMILQDEQIDNEKNTISLKRFIINT